MDVCVNMGMGEEEKFFGILELSLSLSIALCPTPNRPSPHSFSFDPPSFCDTRTLFSRVETFRAFPCGAIVRRPNEFIPSDYIQPSYPQREFSVTQERILWHKTYYSSPALYMHDFFLSYSPRSRARDGRTCTTTRIRSTTPLSMPTTTHFKSTFQNSKNMPFDCKIVIFKVYGHFTRKRTVKPICWVVEHFFPKNGIFY